MDIVGFFLPLGNCWQKMWKGKFKSKPRRLQNL